MHEYTLINKITEEEKITFGHFAKDMFRRYNLNADEWTIVFDEYVD